MSDLAPQVVWPSSVWVDRTQRLRRVVASAAFWTIVATGAGLTVAALFNSLPSYLSSADDIWILAALALAADLVPFRLPPPVRRTTTFLLSPCFCFSMMLLYPPVSGVLPQVLAVAIAARRLRLRWPSLAFLTARLVCALSVAGWVAHALQGPAPTDGFHPGGAEIGIAVPAALVFLAVTMAISLIGALLSNATRAEILAQIRVEVIARSSVLLIGIVIVSTPTIWSHSLLFVPLIGWYALSRLLEERERQIEHDPVTGQLNSHGLAAAVAALPRVHNREADSYELIVVELRGLTHIRRTLGQAVSERLTIAASDRLRADLADSDRIGQLSESQLAVLRPEPNDQGGLNGANGILASLSEPIDSDGIPYRVDPVVGVAVAPQDGREFDVMLANAESALVEADLRQHHASVYTAEAKSDLDDRHTLLRDLGEALCDSSRASEIVILYQPQVSVDTGQTKSVEALLRWHHPLRGLIPPDDLIRLVEPTCVMQQLTHYVLDRVAGQLAEWNRAGLDLRAAVNVSVNDLITDHFDTKLAQTLQAHGLPAHQLDIEITERALVEKIGLLDEAAHRVAALGVGLSLDDFGTGFASLRQLRQMPLAEVKIDKSYVTRIVDNPADRAIVATIHNIAGVLGIRLVAEGVEDEQTARILADLGGVIGQGWLYARPMTAQQLVSWLRHRPPIQIDPGTNLDASETARHVVNHRQPGRVATPTSSADHDRGGALGVTVATEFGTGIVDVTAHGVLDLSSAPVMRRAVIKAAAEEPGCIVVDLNDTVITDERAAAVFIALASRLSESMIGFAVHVGPSDTADLLRRMLVGRVPVRNSRADAIGALSDPGHGYRRRLRVHLMPVPAAPGQARALVDLACVNWGLRVDQDIARLVVSELVTNVVEHARTDLDVSVVCADAHLIIQVSDRSTVMPTMSADDVGSDRLERSGLALVDAVTAGWGVHATDTGKTVWASLRLADDGDRK